jgi:hypothetical protein
VEVRRRVYWLDRGEGGRDGAVGVGFTVGLTGFVDTRYCRCRSVELVYPYVGARFGFRWPYGSQGRIQGRFTADGPNLHGEAAAVVVRDENDNALSRRVAASEIPVEDRYLNSQVAIFLEESRLPVCALTCLGWE